MESFTLIFPKGFALGFEREENDGLKDANLIVLSLLLVKKFI